MITESSDIWNKKKGVKTLGTRHHKGRYKQLQYDKNQVHMEGKKKTKILWIVLFKSLLQDMAVSTALPHEFLQSS